MKKKTVGIITLGCAKNLVDTELMLGILTGAGYKITLDTNQADTVIVNTCAFINDAQKESVNAILQMVQDGKKIIVTGCLAQRYKDELKAEIPEITAILGTCDFDKIIKAIEGKGYKKISEKPCYCYPENVKRAQITVGASSYIKIAEGCSYSCGYCIIPALKGPYKSRKIEDIVQEAKALANKGVGEIILIAQDTSSYGIDLYKKPMLARLLEELNKIENLGWIRVLYTYPTNFNDDLIKAYQTLDKLVKYVDIPLQHSHPDVLRAMRRPTQDYEKLIKKIRKIKDVCIRTTLITGYPAETEEQFEHLYNFVKKMKFDRLGVFEFSREKGTYAYSLKPQIPAKIKRERKNKIMELQAQISKKINESFIGRTIECIVEQINPDGLVVARSFRDAPEIDGVIYIESKKPLYPCDIVKVKVTGADTYNLFGKV